jgi:hypothetical protein
MSDIERELVETYLRIQTNLPFSDVVEPFIPRPSEKDFDLGEIQRYFAQQTNQKTGEITEISRQNFSALQGSSIYTTVSLRWKIAGPSEDTLDAKGARILPGVATANNAATGSAAKTMPSIRNKLTNPFQLWRGF